MENKETLADIQGFRPILDELIGISPSRRLVLDGRDTKECLLQLSEMGNNLEKYPNFKRFTEEILPTLDKRPNQTNFHAGPIFVRGTELQISENLIPEEVESVFAEIMAMHDAPKSPVTDIF